MGYERWFNGFLVPMSKILLTGAASAGAFKVKSLFPLGDIVMGDYEPLPPMPSLIILPSPASATYIHDLLKICLVESVTEIYPIRRAELLALLKAKSLFAEYGTRLVLPFPLSRDEIPVFNSTTCKKLELQADGIFWSDDSRKFLFICD